MTVEGVAFGTSRVDPSNTLIVEAGQERAAYLHVAASEGTEEGGYPFTLTVNSDSDTEKVNLKAYVVHEADEESFWSNVGEVLVWIVIVLAVIILLFALFNEFGRDRKRIRRSDEDIHSYY